MTHPELSSLLQAGFLDTHANTHSRARRDMVCICDRVLVCAHGEGQTTRQTRTAWLILFIHMLTVLLSGSLRSDNSAKPSRSTSASPARTLRHSFHWAHTHTHAHTHMSAHACTKTRRTRAATEMRMRLKVRRSARVAHVHRQTSWMTTNGSRRCLFTLYSSV